jgi:hypothetical protein
VYLKNIEDFHIQRLDQVSSNSNMLVDQQFIELFDITKLQIDARFLPSWPEIADPCLKPYSSDLLEEGKDTQRPKSII